MRHLTHAVAILMLAGICSAGAQEAKQVILPPPEKGIGKPLMQVLALRRSSRDFAATPVRLQDLANLLWAADGINREESGKRTAPSAMNWQETDVYVILADGAYLYDAKTAGLKPVAGGDLRAFAGSQAFVKDAPVNLVYVVDRARMGRARRTGYFTAPPMSDLSRKTYIFTAPPRGLSPSSGVLWTARSSPGR